MVPNSNSVVSSTIVTRSFTSVVALFRFEKNVLFFFVASWLPSNIMVGTLTPLIKSKYRVSSSMEGTLSNKSPPMMCIDTFFSKSYISSKKSLYLLHAQGSGTFFCPSLICQSAVNRIMLQSPRLVANYNLLVLQLLWLEEFS
jgi:hypothetical protein